MNEENYNFMNHISEGTEISYIRFYEAYKDILSMRKQKSFPFIENIAKIGEHYKIPDFKLEDNKIQTSLIALVEILLL